MPAPGAAGAPPEPPAAAPRPAAGPAPLTPAWAARRRYVMQTLRNGGASVDTIDEADVVYVYDYCYHMRALADHHARQHWWLKDRHSPERTTGKHLMSAYRSAACGGAQSRCVPRAQHVTVSLLLGQGDHGAATLAAHGRRGLCLLPRAPGLRVGRRGADHRDADPAVQ